MTSKKANRRLNSAHHASASRFTVAIYPPNALCVHATLSLSIDAASGHLTQARQVPSPNFDARPDGMIPELIVVHGISMPPNEFGGPWIDALFTNSLPIDAHPHFKEVIELRVSSHLLIRRDGELVQYVSFNDRAWHAGKSNYCGRERCNDYSIGIELEGTDNVPYEPVRRNVAEW